MLSKNKFNWKSAIRLNLLVLRSVGLWPEDDFYKFDCYLVYVTSAAIFLVGGFNLSQIANVFYVYTDFEAVTSSVLLITTNLLAVVKMYIFLKNLRFLKKLLTTLNTSDFRPRSSQELKLVEPTLRRWKKIYLWYNTVVVFNLLMWSVAPALEGWRLPFDAWFPFDVKVSPFYELAYFYQLLCMWPMSLCNINLDCFIMGIMMLMYTQLELLCFHLKTLGNQKNFGEELVGCIKRHKAILGFIERSNKFFNWIILGQFATSTAVIALIMFQLTIVSPASGEGLSHIAYIHGITTQIFLYCWFGNQVEIKSRQIPWSLYESEWIIQSQSVKKNILILCIRCQRPVRITAIKLFSLSLETFILIMRSAYSYFALLSNVTK